MNDLLTPKTPAMSKPLSARAVARELGIDHTTLLRIYREGVIDAEVHEGAVIRFDLEKVRKTLAKRAKQNRQTVRAAAEVMALVI